MTVGIDCGNSTCDVGNTTTVVCNCTTGGNFSSNLTDPADSFSSNLTGSGTLLNMSPSNETRLCTSICNTLNQEFNNVTATNKTAVMCNCTTSGNFSSNLTHSGAFLNASSGNDTVLCTCNHETINVTSATTLTGIANCCFSFNLKAICANCSARLLTNNQLLVSFNRRIQVIVLIL